VQAAVRVQVRHAARGAQAQVRHLRPAQVHARAVQHRVQAAPARAAAPSQRPVSAGRPPLRKASAAAHRLSTACDITLSGGAAERAAGSRAGGRGGRASGQPAGRQTADPSSGGRDAGSRV